VAVLADPQAMSCVTIAASSSPSDYLFIAANANPMPGTGSYTVSYLEGPLAAAAAPAPLGAAPLDANGAFDFRLRAMERRLLNLADARAAAARPQRAARAAAVAVGDSLTFRVPNGNATNACASYFTVRAVVKAVGAHGIIVQDTAAPASGFTPTDFAAISSEFDGYIYATDTTDFGSPSDLDANGHVYLLYTPQVNTLTAQGAQSFITGFFFSGDLFPTSACAESNRGELFYLMVPVPAGKFGDARSTALVRQVTRGTMAHEFEHMINLGVRLRNPAAAFESVWLDETLAHFAEEYVGRAEDGFAPFQKLRFSDVSANSNDYSAFFRNSLHSFQSWLLRPDTASSIANTDRILADGGAAWALLHYTADQFAGGDLAGFTTRLTAGPDSGLKNLVATAGVPFDTLMAGWMVAVYADGLGIPGLASRYTFTSWNYRDAEAGISAGTYPLTVTPLFGSSGTTTTAPSGSGNYFRLTSSPTTPAGAVRLLATNGALVGFAGARLYVLRVE
jgi:hypothetical protein